MYQTKILGLLWEKKEEKVQIEFEGKFIERPTKRKITDQLTTIFSIQYLHQILCYVTSETFGRGLKSISGLLEKGTI